MSDFNTWWNQEGSGMRPDDHEDTEEFAKRITAIAWSNGAFCEQPWQEPVAWSYWQSCLNDDGTQTAPWVHRLSKFQPSESVINKDITPLYTSPPAQRKPLTDEQLRVIENKINPNMRWRSSDEEGITLYPSEYYELVRAIEAAHGIKGDA